MSRCGKKGQQRGKPRRLLVAVLNCSFVMGEKIQFKGKTSQLALSSNRKEETLLKRKLSILESMERQAANSLTLEQKILYKRFTTKLRRSEMAHAKLLGIWDLAKQLTQSACPTFHTTVTDNTESAVRAILQNTRVTSAPGRLQSQGIPLLSAGNQSGGNYQDEEGKNKDVSIKWSRVSGNEVHLGTGDVRQDCGKVCNLGTNSFSASSLLWRADKRVHFDHPQRHTTTDKKSNREQFAGDCIPCASSVLITTQHEDPAANNAELRAPVSPEGRASSRRPKGAFPRHPYNSGGNGRGNHILRPSSRSLFLGLRETQMGPSFVNAQLMAKEEAGFNDKVKLFVQKVKVLKQQQGSLLKDYYSERLLDKLDRKHQANQDLLLDMQQEQKKWTLVGAEPSHRSITIKKLDRNFIRKDIPAELLICEYYNEILTKENQFERNWLNNNPYHMIIRKSLAFVSKGSC